MTTPQERWNKNNPKKMVEATQKWQKSRVKFEFFLTPEQADPLLKMPGSRNGNAKRLLLEALKELE